MIETGLDFMQQILTFDINVETISMSLSGIYIIEDDYIIILIYHVM